MHPQFGRYELLKRLAGGGMGEVYLARQSGIDGFQKLLVVKTLLPHLCEDEEFITMFKDEARVTAQLIHPNICQVFEFEQVGGVFYMSMEYLRGEDLRRLWKTCEQRGIPLRVPLICRIISDAAAGLDFAHSLRDSKGEPYNIVHRDISPQNILVTFEGGVKVIDFGVAKAAGRAQHTRTGALKGKYSYMSPEQVAGQSIDNRSDIFALGIVLHELLTGRRLFKADSDVQTLARVREAIVPPPSRLNPQLPPGLDAIVLKALAKDPDQRYGTAQEMRLAIEDWLIQGRMSASSAHLAEFLKQIYGERLEKEAKLGPLMGDPGFSGPVPGITPSGNAATPSQPTTDIQGKGAPVSGDPTVNHRSHPEALAKRDDPSVWSTLSGVPPFVVRNKWPFLGATFGAVILATAFVVMRPPAATEPDEPEAAEMTLMLDPPNATVKVDGKETERRFIHKPGPVTIEVSAEGYEPKVVSSSLGSGPQTMPVALQKMAPKSHNVTITIDPSGTEIYEGSRLIGKSPKIWREVPPGEHELTFQHEGYHEAKEKIVVSRDDEITFKPLKKIDTPKKAPPDLGIKAER